MSRYKESTYTPYVRHAMRFYARYQDITEFRSETDRANWEACHRAMQEYSPVSKEIFLYVYGERDTLEDNVYIASKKYELPQDSIWDLMRRFERSIAVERGLA